MAKLLIRSKCHVSDEVLGRHRDYSRALGLPRVGDGAGALAVVGGGHSVVDHLPALSRWDGPIWAINGTHRFLRERGIGSSLYMIDPIEWPDQDVFSGVSHAVLADIVHPRAFDTLLAAGATVELATLGEGPDEIRHWNTAAATSPFVAATAGFKRMTIFGCDGSFPETGDAHAYKWSHGSVPSMWVRCGDKDFATTPGYVAQTELLAEIARALPNFLRIASGSGFLSALVEAGDYDVTHTNRAIAGAIETAA